MAQLRLGTESGTGAAVSRPLPSPSSAVSFDLHLDPRSALTIEVASGDLKLRQGPTAPAAMELRGRTYALAQRSGWSSGGWHHFEATSTRLAVDGRSFPGGLGHGSTITFHLRGGTAQVDTLIISAASNRDALLLHRLAELHARIPPGQFPLGADRSDRIHYGDTYWTNGFWAGALWQAASLVVHGASLFSGWALTATVQHFGQERSDTHDVGFMYEQSSLAAWRALCQKPLRAPASLCARLRSSVVSAANELLALASSNSHAGTIPTDDSGPQANTIIDSMMNVAILTWASRMTGNPVYEQVESRHAHLVASLLVRRDGSTIQSVNFDRATGRVLFKSTHQGLSNSSTWARGQGWAVYGFAQTAADLHDRGLLGVAVRTAQYVARHLPAGGVPRWDYDAPAGAPLDVSAGVITAAGLLHLAGACRSLPGVCVRPSRWVALGRRMLTAALGHARATPPLGFLGDQVLNERGAGPGCWCNRGELIFGVTYALEGLRLEGLRVEGLPLEKSGV